MDIVQSYRMFPSTSDDDLLLAAILEHAEQSSESPSSPRRSQSVPPPETSGADADDRLRRTPGANRPVTPRPPSPGTEARHGDENLSRTFLMDSGALLHIQNVSIDNM
jgi:hypothetical protein